MSKKIFKTLKRNFLCVLTALALVVTNALPVGVIGAAADEPDTYWVTIEKRNFNDEHLPGAMLELTGLDSDGNVVNFPNDSIEAPDDSVSIINGSGDKLVWVTGNEPVKVLLQPGTYTLHEAIAPNGYQEASDIIFEIDKSGIVTINGEAVGTIQMIDETADVEKTEPKKEPFSVSKTDIAESNEVPGAELAVYKAEDIADGMPKEGTSSIISWISGSTPKTLTAEEMAKFDAGDYYLVEVGAPNGYAYSESVMFTLVLDEENNAIKLSSGNTVTMKDEAIGDVYISKTDVGGGDEVEGAKLTVYLKEDVTVTTDENGNETVTVKDGAEAVESWTSGTEAHKIEGSKLIADKTYVLVEEGAPDGYAYTDSIEFTIEKDGSVSGDSIENGVITMKDEAIGDVYISKTDVGGGNEIGGAKLKITDSNGNSIAEWTSVEGESYKVPGSKLKAGETYTLTETGTPDGYAYAESIDFTIEKDGTVTRDGKKVDDRTIKMIDEAIGGIMISKSDIASGEEIVGAKLAVYLNDDITITKDENGNETVTVKDGRKAVEAWTSGTTPHSIDVNKLTAGQTYVLVEEGAPMGYTYTDSIAFTLNSDGTVSCESLENGIITMKDEAIGDVEISKIDAANGKEIAGATLTITDSEGNVIETWVSEANKTHTVPGSKFKAGETYTLTEENAPDGYAYAESIRFTIGKDGSVNGGDDRTIVMKDELLKANDTPSAIPPSAGTDPSISGNRNETTSNVNNTESTASEDVGAGAGITDSGESADNGTNTFTVVSVCIAAFIAAAFAVKRKLAK